MKIILYIIVILLANVVTASFLPLKWEMFIIPYGTFLIGLTFILRDLVQQQYGRRGTYKIIGVALLLSAVSSYLLGDTLWIVIASALSFIISETTDTEIYTRLKLPMSWRVLYSGIVGGLLDSVVFVVIGLSPIGANFVTWGSVPMVIVGQMIVKTIMQGLGASIIGIKERLRFL